MRIIHGRIITCEGAVYEDGFISFENGVITKIGDMADLPCSGGECLDVEGSYVLPGFIDPHCHVGVGPEASGAVEYSEVVDPIVPHYCAVDAYYPFDTAIPKALSSGITTVITGPGSTTLIGGQLSAIKLNGEFASSAAVKKSCAMKFALGSAPLKTFKSYGKAPFTRMAAMAMLRQTLHKARHYMECQEKGIDISYDMKCEALIPLLRREIPAHIHANRADDIRAGIHLMNEFNIRCVIVHASQAAIIMDEIKKMGASVIFGPLYFTSRDQESEGMRFELPRLAEAAGVQYAVCTDACPHLSSIQLLLPSAALAVRKGASVEKALQAVTLNAARFSGIDDRVGSLAVGKDADISVFTKHPFDFSAKPSAVFINGRRMI